MPPEMVVLTDLAKLDYETLATHLLRVSYQQYREEHMLVIDYSNPPLADLLEQYAEEEQLLCRRIVRSLDEALQIADTVLLFASPDRTEVLKRCNLENARRSSGAGKAPFQLFVVAQPDDSHG